MVAFVALKQVLCPRDRAVQLMFALDPSVEPYFVGTFYNGQVQRLAAFRDVKYAMMELEDEVSRPGPGGDADWLAVLARCRGKAPIPARWDGSPAEYATRFAPIGTFEWLQIMRSCPKEHEQATKLEGVSASRA